MWTHRTKFWLYFQGTDELYRVISENKFKSEYVPKFDKEMY